MSQSCKKQLICLTILLSLFSLSTSRDTLTPTQSLSDGETIISAGGTFTLGFFTPSNTNNSNRYVGIWYSNIPTHEVIWVANRRSPIDGLGGKLLVATDGALIVTNGNSTVTSLSALKVTNPTAKLLDTGNFVVTGESQLGFFAWQSFDYPTDTLVPGMKLGWNLTSGLNCNLTAWSSATDPSPGSYALAMDLRGDPQLILWDGSKRKLRSGPWTGLDFSGLAPYNRTYTPEFTSNFVNNKEEVYFIVGVDKNSTITRLVLSPSGVLQQFVWVDSGQWVLYWYTPRSPCDTYLACGPYGAVCSPNGSPMCSCLPGFSPKMPANWDLRDWSDGCIRKTALDCRTGTDGFITVQQTLLPDTVSARVDTRMSLNECMAECLKNCSCTAFASADTRGGGTGCIIWSTDLSDILVYSEGGQDLHMRLAAADIGSASGQSHTSGKATIVVVLCVVLGILLLVTVACCAWRKQKRTRGNASINKANITESTGEVDIELPLFDLETVTAATNNFSSDNKLGEGGFGPVFKGKVSEGQEIAVKRLSKNSVQGHDELKTEVILVAKLQHRNLVRILGCCIQGDERMLIYEYMPNKSLDNFLFDEEKRVLLDWRTRYHIILGIARGLLYLHQDSRFRIIHRDLKASNILLDNDMNPKISDFGLARIFGEDETRTKTRRVVGTYGYMSPEYALNGIFSIKSDVFSFGVLVLEIISSIRNKGVYLSEAEEYLLGKAWTLWKDGKGLQLVDASLDCSVLTGEVLRCMKVGLLCVQECPEDRPTMSSVVLMLGSDHAFLPEPKQPGFVARRSSPGETSSLNNENAHSINDVTMTMSIAR